MSTDVCVELFSQLGFTKLEAEIYVYLIQHSPATGYKISKDIGRSKTNTYKAISALQTKGAIDIDDGEAQQCRAVPPGELLDQIEHQFHERRRQAAEAVKGLSQASRDFRVYQLSTVEQVYSRCRRMLRECERVALLDLFPEPISRLRDDIAATAARGVKVAVQVYEPTEIPGAQIILNRSSADILRRWSVHWASQFIDGNQYLIALLAAGGREVHQARWSESPVLSWGDFSYAHSDFLLASLAPLLEEDRPLEELRTIYRDWQQRYPEGFEPGYQYLVDRFGWG